jgi:3-oxoacyl-[acyl-carrier-protein] synthase II
MLFPLTPPMRRNSRVVITGAGIVSALGPGWEANCRGFRAGVVARRPVSLFDVSRQRVKVAAEVGLSEPVPFSGLPAGCARRMDRAAKLLYLAVQEAWQQCGWQPSEHLPLVLGTTGGDMKLGEDYYRQTVETPIARRRQPSRVLYYQAQRQGLEVASAFGLGGPLIFIANACASGANAIGHAWDLVRLGQTDRALAGGYEALSQLIFAGFDSLQALSMTQCRPFDAHRDGLALGEGAAVLALEAYDSARKRGASILGELAGYGASTDVHHLTQPQPEGSAALASMTAACQSAGLTPLQIDYVNAHGTGTPLNDSAEAAAINRWAGDRAATLPVSSTKSSVGHLLGAAGAVEAVVCLMALRGQWMPPTSTLETPDPACRFPVVRKPTDGKLDYVLSNSFGFGGANATLILRRWA